MNVRQKAIGGAVVIAAIALIFAYPAFAAATSTRSATPALGLPNGPGAIMHPLASTGITANVSPSALITPPTLSVGQTLTLTSVNGQWRVLSTAVQPDAASGTSSGQASGTLTLTVTGVFKYGYALSITSGSLSINGTTYTIASGSVQMGPWLAHVVGQGSFTSVNPGSFLMAGAAHGDFLGNTHNVLRFDVQANGAEYGVVLLVDTVSS